MNIASAVEVLKPLGFVDTSESVPWGNGKAPGKGFEHRLQGVSVVRYTGREGSAVMNPEQEALLNKAAESLRAGKVLDHEGFYAMQVPDTIPEAETVLEILPWK